MVLSNLINFAKHLLKLTPCVISIYYTLCLKKKCPKIHQKRINSLMVATESLLDGNQLSLTQLGHNITSSVAAKHNIKRIDRLLGNHQLAQDKITLYQWHSRYLWGSNPMPIILVDCSDVREQLRIITLRASISVQGRSVTYMNALFYLKTTTHLTAIIRFSLNSPMFYLKAVVRSS